MTGFFDGKEIAITGANGFVGSWLTEALVNRGAKVTILLRKNSIVGRRSIKSVLGDISIIYGDIREAKPIKELVKDKDIIFHLAAITQVIYAKNRPVETFDVDANGTLNLLEAIRASKDQPFMVHMSTDKVYGEPQRLPIDESHPLLGKSPYDVSKLAADCLVHSYHTTYGMRSSVIRCSNIIGGRDGNFLRIVPDTIRAIIKKERPKIRGNGMNLRDYMHVKDAVNALMLVAERQKTSTGEAFNIGTERPTSVLDITNMIIRAAGKQGAIKPKVLNQDLTGEIDKQYLSSKKARSKLGWKPKYSLEDGISESVDWYTSNLWWQEVLDDNISYYRQMKIGY